MKLNLLETHDRLEHFKKQNFSIEECVQSLINQRPFGEHAFYIFAHPRTDEDGVTKRMIWQPRLTKPKAQTNSMLFKVYPGTDVVKIIWMIPERHLWPQYNMDKMTHSKIVYDSIQDFQFDRQKLDKAEEDDLPDHIIEKIYRDLSLEARMNKSKSKENSVSI